MDSDVWVLIVVGTAMLVGLFGTLIPFVPGLPLIWAAAMFYGYDSDWTSTGVVAMLLITVIMLAGVAAKIVLPSKRVTESGAPRSTLFIGGVAGIIGFFVIPVVGLPVGAIAGVLLAEHRRTNDWDAAWASTKSAIIGFGIGTLIEIGAGIAMIACWVVWALLEA